MAIRVKYSIMIIMNAPLLGAIFGGYLMPYQHFLCSMMLPGLGIASKLSLHLKITLLPFGRDVILRNYRHLVHIAVVL